MARRPSSAPPIPPKSAPPGLRQRQRADGSWRIWWEPSGAARAKGFGPIELDAGKITWSINEAKKQGKAVTRALVEGAVPRAGLRTMSALMDAYQKSPAYTKLAEKTRSDYAVRMKAIKAKWGDELVTSFTKPVMRAWYETLMTSSGEWQAVAQLRIMSLLFSYAELTGWRAEDSNPCRRLKMSTPDPRNRAASWAEYDALLQAARDLDMPAMECAIAMAVLTGQRQKDIRQARRDGFRLVDQGRKPQLLWFLRRSKRDNLGSMPIHPELEPLIRAQLMRNEPEPAGALLLDPNTGAPFTEAGFQERWRSVRALAAKSGPALADLQFRDLRRTFGVFARAGGATVDDVGNVLGNSVAVDPQLEETYLPATYDTTARAVSAVKRPGQKHPKSAGSGQ